MVDSYLSGNEGISREHWLRPATALLVLLLGVTGWLWINLAHVSASYRPGWDGAGPLGVVVRVFQPGEIGPWIGVLNPLQRAALPTLFGPPNPVHVAWSGWWRYALAHAVGAPATPATAFADRLPMIGINLFLFLLVAVVPTVLLSDAVTRLVAGRGPDRRLGTAAWAPTRDLRPFLRAVGQPGSLSLGRIAKGLPASGRGIAMPLRDRQANVSRFSHTALWGVTEAGKTSGIYKPWLWTDLWMNDLSRTDAEGRPVGAMSSFVIDMKHGDFYETLVPYAVLLPRRVLVLAPGDARRSMHYNPLDFVLDSEGRPRISDIQLLTDAIVPSPLLDATGVGFHRGNEHRFADLLIQYVCEVQYAIDRGVAEVQGVREAIEDLVRPHLPTGLEMPYLRSLPMVAYLLRSYPASLLRLMQSTVTDPAGCEIWPSRIVQFVELDHHGEPRPGRDTTGWLQDLVTRFGAFAAPEVAAISSHSDFSLDLIGRQPSTLILGMPSTSTQSLETYSALLITQQELALRRLAGESPKRRLPVPVTMYLDEFANQGRVPKIEEALATDRDFGIAFMLGIQNTAQLRKRYGDDTAMSMLSNTNTKILLGRNCGFEDAEWFSRATGDTTILAASMSSGGRGALHARHEARRPFRTPDQIRAMDVFEAFVFLQNGRFTQTRLRPFHEFGRALRNAPRDLRFIDGVLSPDGQKVDPIVLLRQRHRELDRVLGPWDRRPARRATPSPAVISSDVPVGPGAVSVVAEIADRARRQPPAAVFGRDPGSARQSIPIAESLDDAGADSPAPPDGSAQAPATTADDHQASSGPTTGATDGERTSGHVDPARGVEPPASKPGAAPAAQPTQDSEGDPAREQQAAEVEPRETWDAVGSLVGFFNAIARAKLMLKSTPNGAAPGWRLSLPSGDHVFVRWAYVQAYGERGRTKPGEIARRWARAGFVVAARLRVDERADSIAVIAFTPSALARLTRPVAEQIAGWPPIEPGCVHGLDAQVLAGPQARDAAQALTRGVTASAPQGTSPGRAAAVPVTPISPVATTTKSAAQALDCVVTWARANQSALQMRSVQELGQWEAVVQGELVLFIRQHHLARILMRSKFDFRAVLEEWRHVGVIVAPEGERRFTVYARMPEGGQRGARFVAFRWERLEATGLVRE